MIDFVPMPIRLCEKCGHPLDYFSTFATVGVSCRGCGWKKEINQITGEIKETEHVNDMHVDGTPEEQ